MKRTLLIAATAIALSAPAVPHAHADQWVDTNTGAALGDMPEDSTAIDLLKASKSVCRIKTGVAAGAPVTPAYLGCMKREGYIVLKGDTPAQAQAKAIADAQTRVGVGRCRAHVDGSGQ